MTTDQHTKKLSKFLEYVLARRPDEFGLIPDPDGFVKVKTLFQALHEDPEWRHLREAHVNTLCVSESTSPIEIQEDRIRAIYREQLPTFIQPKQWPKLLYVAVRQRAYPVVHEKGLRPTAFPFLVLSSESTMALRLGRRSDNAPVLLTIQVAKAQAAGTYFQQYGENLFLADVIAPDCLNGPPLPKEKPADSLPKKPPQPKMPGSFFPDLTSSDKHGAAPHQKPQRPEINWKKDRRRARKEKENRWG
jgi:putative RNA 2'-phosphotransferase